MKKNEKTGGIYITKERYGGYDWRDSKTTIHHLKENESYKISQGQELNCICDDILRQFPYADRNAVMLAINGEKPYTFYGPKLGEKDCFSSEKGHETWDHKITIDGLRVLEDVGGGISEAITTYSCCFIPDESVCFLPVEQLYAVAKGVSVVERIFHEPFKDQKEAESEVLQMKMHSKNGAIQIMVYDYNEITASQIYKKNMEVVQLMKQHPKLSAIFHPNVHVHLQLLKNALGEV